MSRPSTATARILRYECLARRVWPVCVEKQLRVVVAGQVKDPITGDWRDKQAANAGTVLFVTEVRIDRQGVEDRHDITLARIIGEVDVVGQESHCGSWAAGGVIS